MPSRLDLNTPARATRSASRNKAPARPSKAVKRPPRGVSKAKGSANRTSRSRVTKATDRKPTSNPRPRSGQARVKKCESPLIKIKNEEGDDDDAKGQGPSQQQHTQGIAGPSYPRPPRAGSWQWVPVGRGLSVREQQGPPPFPQHNQPDAGNVEVTTATPALQELYWQRHYFSFEGIDLSTFLYEYQNIRGRFPLIEWHWFAAIWKGEMNPNDLERMALKDDSLEPSPQFVEDPSERKYRLLLSGFEIYSTVLCQSSPERRLLLHEAFATYRLHLLFLLRTRTLDSVIDYHHLSVGQAMTHGQDHPEHWDMQDGHCRYSVLQRRPDLPRIQRHSK